MGWPKGKKRGPRRPSANVNDKSGHAPKIVDRIGDDSDAAPEHPTTVVHSDGGTVIIDPTAAIGDGSAGSGGDPGSGSTGRRARRGRKAKKTPYNISGLETLLYSVHSMGSALLKVEELAIEESEAKTLAVAIGRVAEQYDDIPGMSETTAAWVNLGMVAGMMYGSRIIAYRARKGFEAKETTSTSLM